MADVNFAAKRFRSHNVETVVDYFRFAVGAAGAVGTITQGSGAFVTSVTKTATGRYTVQLASPYPASLLFVNPSLSASGVTANTFLIRYKEASYSATAGTFEIDVSVPAGAGAATTQVASDPENPSSIGAVLAFLEV